MVTADTCIQDGTIITLENRHSSASVQPWLKVADWSTRPGVCGRATGSGSAGSALSNRFKINRVWLTTLSGACITHGDIVKLESMAFPTTYLDLCSRATNSDCNFQTTTSSDSYQGYARWMMLTWSYGGAAYDGSSLYFKNQDTGQASSAPYLALCGHSQRGFGGYEGASWPVADASSEFRARIISYEWTTGAWSGCSEQCGSGVRSRYVSCPGTCHNGQPSSMESCFITACSDWVKG